MKNKALWFISALAWVWVLIYAWEYKEPDCFPGDVVERVRTVNQFTGEYEYQITVQNLKGELLTTKRVTSGGYHMAAQGTVLICRDTGRFTKIKSPWYTH